MTRSLTQALFSGPKTSVKADLACALLCVFRNHVICALPQLKKMDFSAVTREQRVLANVWRHCYNRGENTKASLH